MTDTTITLPRSVVEQALEALYTSMPHNNDMDEDWPSHIAARRALRTALQQPQVEQEPVAVVTGFYGGFPTIRPLEPATVLPYGMALYAHPQPHRQPLTDEQLNCLWRQTLGEPHAPRKSAFDFARSIEAAHGIGGEA